MKFSVKFSVNSVKARRLRRYGAELAMKQAQPAVAAGVLLVGWYCLLRQAHALAKPG